MYICIQMFLNISRNLLLAVPPQIREIDLSSLTTTTSDTTSQVLEIKRDPELVKRYPHLKSAPQLDIKSKSSRAEIKLLVEQFLRGNNNTATTTGLKDSQSHEQQQQQEHGMARFVEVSVGRGSWILRAADHTELLETSFTGVYTTFSYHEDK